MEISKSSMEVELPLCTGRIRLIFFPFFSFLGSYIYIHTLMELKFHLKRPVRRGGGSKLPLSLSLKVPNLLSKPPPSSLLHHKCRIAIGRNMGGAVLDQTALDLEPESGDSCEYM